MAQTTDQVLAYRRMLMISFLVGWGAWYGFFILRETGLQSLWGEVVDIVIGVFGMVGWLVFAVALWRIFRLRKRYRDDPAALAALSDELMRSQRASAMRVGLMALIGFQIVLIFVGQPLGWNAVQAAHASIFIGVAAWVCAALWLEREID